MSIRWLLHKRDGKTVMSGWNSNEKSFRKNWSDNITSIQLQDEFKCLYTLSIRKNEKSIFWQSDDFVLNTANNNTCMIARKIFKNIGKHIWIELKLINGLNKPEINILNKRIKIG